MKFNVYSNKAFNANRRSAKNLTSCESFIMSPDNNKIEYQQICERDKDSSEQVESGFLNSVAQS